MLPAFSCVTVAARFLRCFKVETMEFSVTRVRLTGDIPFFDHGRVREACESGVDPMACKMLHLDYRFPIFDNDTNNG